MTQIAWGDREVGKKNSGEPEFPGFSFRISMQQYG